MPQHTDEERRKAAKRALRESRLTTRRTRDSKPPARPVRRPRTR